MPTGDTTKVELEFGNVGFCRKGKTGVPGEKPLGARTWTNNKLNTHMTPSPGLEPRPQRWEASALITALSLLPLNNTLFSFHLILMPNRPFPNCLAPLFQSEASCKTFHMKISFICMWMKTHFHIKGYAPRLALKKRHKTTRKWPIYMQVNAVSRHVECFSHHLPWQQGKKALYGDNVTNTRT